MFVDHEAVPMDRRSRSICKLGEYSNAFMMMMIIMMITSCMANATQRLIRTNGEEHEKFIHAPATQAYHAAREISPAAVSAACVQLNSVV